jgi:hypothetical protein
VFSGIRFLAYDLKKLQFYVELGLMGIGGSAVYYSA